MFNFVRMFVFLVLLIGGVCGFLAIVGQGASEGMALLDGAASRPSVDQMVETEIAAGRYLANTATPEPVPGPSATPTAYAPPAKQAAPAEAATPTNGVLILSSVSTKFYYEVDGLPYDIRLGTYLLLEFEQEGPGNEGWYGVRYLGQTGFVHMYEFDLPRGIYTQGDLRALLPWGSW